MRSSRLTEEAAPTMFFCGAQDYPSAQNFLQVQTLAARTGLDPSATISMLREVVKGVDANVPAFNVCTLEQQKDQSLSLQRLAATLLGSFGVLALLLAALGIYGVLAYAVRRRTREIGIRMALGARVGDVLRLVLRQGLALAGVGMVIGLAGSVATTHLLRGFLFGIQPLDPLTFAAVAAVLAGVAVVACWLPARRAARIDPMVAVRYE
jgi:ABC-type antimicrobial peptide transport system permease subunit